MRSSPPVPRNRHAGAFSTVCLRAAVLLVIAGKLSSAASTAEAPPIVTTSVVTPPIVFVSRTFDAITKPELRVQPVERAREGRLLVREPGGTVRTLVDALAEDAGPDAPLDVIDPSVSHDAERIVFSGYSPLEEAWRIYEIHADGTSLRRLTRSDRRLDVSRFGEAGPEFESYDDVDPCYLPDGRICFVSSRYPGFAPAGRVRTTNLYVAQADGSDVHRITSERFGGETPAVDPRTGKIVYSRWWLTVPGEIPTREVPPPPGPPPYYGPPPSLPLPPTNAVLSGIAPGDFDGVNSWFLSSIRPDGSEGGGMFTGFGLDRELTMAWRPAFGSDGEILTLFLTVPPFLGNPGEHGLRAVRPGANLPEPLGGPQTFDGSASMPDPNPAVPTAPFQTPKLIYHSAELLPDGRILATGYRPGSGRIEGGLANYDVFVQDRDSAEPERLFGDPSTGEFDAVPLVATPRPPILRDVAPRLDEGGAPRTVEEAIEANGSFRFLVENIFMNAPIDVPIATAPPVSSRLAIEFFMNPQRDGGETPRRPVLVRRMNVPANGRIDTTLPAGVPLFEVLRLPDEKIALGRDGQVFHVGGMNYGVAGRIARCVGCHAGHSQMEIPEDPVWVNVAPSAVVSASSTASSVAHRELPPASLLPSNLVDRKRDLLGSEWAGRANDPAPSVTLEWNEGPVRAREMVIYGPRLGQGFYLLRTLNVRGFRVELFRGNSPVASRSGPAIRPDGTVVPLDPNLSFNRLRISFQPEQISGVFEGTANQLALAEIEVLGRVGTTASETFGFLRGDVDCDTTLDLNDPVKLLAHLFLGSRLCCEESADINLDGRLDTSDAIYHLHWQFLGGAPPSEPWPDCARVPASSRLSCEDQTCR